MSESSTSPETIVLGIDTHRDAHVCVALDPLGRLVGVRSVATTPHGYEELLTWARNLGTVTRAGIEGTGSYGAALARMLGAAGIAVIEVCRPDRARRRRRGKSDATDAENAARAVLSGEAAGVPKAQDGIVEALRMIMVARRSAVKARTQASNQLRCLLITASPTQRATLGRGTLAACMARCAALETPAVDALEQARTGALRALARRWTALTEELRGLDATLNRLTKTAAPRLLGRRGIGPHTAATLLITAGDNPDRLRSDAALAALCGVSPVEASSGRVTRHRLNRGGDRQANNALWTVTLVRARSDARTKEYVARRTAEGRTLKEIFRCLKRYLVRELYPLLLADLADARQPALT
jgi:transposase